MAVFHIKGQLTDIMLNMYGFYISLYFLTLMTTTITSGIQGSEDASLSEVVQHFPLAIDIKDKILELQCYAKCENYFRVRQMWENNGNDWLFPHDNTTDFEMEELFLAIEPRIDKNLPNIRPMSNVEASRFNVEMANCQNQCAIEQIKRPKRGYCPKASLQNVTFGNINETFDEDAPCIENCRYDFDCPDVQKCCEASCGLVCRPASGLRIDKNLPDIPTIRDYKVLRGNKVVIELETSTRTISYFHVEVRFHIGKHYSERKLSPWQWQNVDKIAESTDSRKIQIGVSFSIKPGRWYQVRVAAINAFGFRGYSNLTIPFALRTPPKPPKAPADLAVLSSRLVKGFYHVRIIWCPSKSNLPIEKYKVIWSLYVKSKQQSFISNEAFVKDAHYYEIEKLQPNSTYFLQVQAISINGRKRLKSDKYSLLYNTTTSEDFRAPQTLRCARNRQFSNYAPSDYKYEKLQTRSGGLSTSITRSRSSSSTPIPNSENTYSVRYRMNRKFGMIVLITGFHPQKEKVYELCPKDIDCEQREYRAIRAKKNSLEFSKLNFNTTYILKAFEDKDIHASVSSFTFTTPLCENFSRRFPKIQIKC